MSLILTKAQSRARSISSIHIVENSRRVNVEVIVVVQTEDLQLQFAFFWLVMFCFDKRKCVWREGISAFVAVVVVVAMVISWFRNCMVLGVLGARFRYFEFKLTLISINSHQLILMNFYRIVSYRVESYRMVSYTYLRYF